MTSFYAVQNKQYSCKNNIRISGMAKKPEENLKEKVIHLARDLLEVDIQPKEIEIVHRIGQRQRRPEQTPQTHP